ncbi:MAG: hypothetical protein RM049_34310 [Nostoc sp. DedQUE04]|uniref:hypothetical protein n=1 Tax=Nostoc sp. DedQUE04 TaxID=3075390 RepID=UPI002AD29635|nr:hypothetical protein [Nostoc sp. DedQUE04]MDZ8140310.1 hypothetical protein [Nostoc sp. DedQUE04]
MLLYKSCDRSLIQFGINLSIGCVKRSCLDILTGDLVVYAVTHRTDDLVRYFVNAPYKIGRSLWMGGAKRCLS